MKRIALIRHGLTKGNLSKCYIGKTDEPLCDEGIKELLLKTGSSSYPSTNRIYCSPMLRCQMTANLLYPNRELKLVSDFRECDFGLFEGKNYEELSTEPLYQQWIDSNGMIPFPSGESREGFEYRCREAYKNVIKELYQETSASNNKIDRTVNREIDRKINKETEVKVKNEAEVRTKLEVKSEAEVKAETEIETEIETGKEADAVLIVHGGTIMAILSAFAIEKKDYYAWGCGNGNGYLLNVMEDGRLEVITKI